MNLSHHWRERVGYHIPLVDNPLKPVGYFTIGGYFNVTGTRRPSWIARVMSRWLLDWRWHDIQQVNDDR